MHWRSYRTRDFFMIIIPNNIVLLDIWSNVSDDGFVYFRWQVGLGWLDCLRWEQILKSFLNYGYTNLIELFWIIFRYLSEWILDVIIMKHFSRAFKNYLFLHLICTMRSTYVGMWAIIFTLGALSRTESGKLIWEFASYCK